MPDEKMTGTKAYRTRLKAFERDAESWRSHWKEIADYMMPRKGRYLTGNDEKANDGKKKHQRIINGTTNDALRTIAAGMQGGLTSPSRPWFRLSLQDRDLMEFAPVKEWLHDTREGMLKVYSRSNFYGALHGLYKETAAFGTNAMIMEDDDDTIMRVVPLTVGEFYLGLSPKFRPDTLYRKFVMTPRQVVMEFGINNVSRRVKELYEAYKEDERIIIVQAIQPNMKRDIGKDDFTGMPFESIYFEYKCDDQEAILRRSGYRSIPFVAPRWELTGRDEYGHSPGMDALGDTKMLQSMEEKKLKALAKMVDPPMNAPSQMKQTGGTIIPGGVNYVDVAQGQQGFSPAYQVNPDVMNIGAEIREVEMRIRRFFFNDLFLAIINQNKTMTATEVAQRHEEKLLVLGPVLERLQSELLDPIIERTYNIMVNMEKVPPPPPELEGMEVEVEYISLLAQAQKMVGITAIEQTAAFVGNLAGVSPEIVDKVDFDEMVDKYGESLGVPPTIIRPDDMVAEIRAQRAQQQAQQQAVESAPGSARAAKDMSEIDMNNPALQAILGGPQGGEA